MSCVYFYFYIFCFYFHVLYLINGMWIICIMIHKNIFYIKIKKFLLSPFIRVNQNILYIRNEKKCRPPDYLQL